MNPCMHSAMGGSFSSSYNPSSSSFLPPLAATVLLVDDRILHYAHPVKVIEVLIDHPDHVLCASSSFRIGTPISALPVQDHLQLGQLYFLIPSQTFHTIRLPSFGRRIAAAVAPPAGRKLPRRVPFTVMRNYCGSERAYELFGGGKKCGNRTTSNLNSNRLCDTPDLKKAYLNLMGARCRDWKPALQTIGEAASLRV